ncbi:hypothetical protein GQ53DRAFT_208781 [Thozetella sp. PMI_491]|nr:hypothetical protein GQ53DRAFT_208781 [Thozetella sp. PMI_491]
MSGNFFFSAFRYCGGRYNERLITGSGAALWSHPLKPLERLCPVQSALMRQPALYYSMPCPAILRLCFPANEMATESWRYASRPMGRLLASAPGARSPEPKLTCTRSPAYFWPSKCSSYSAEEARHVSMILTLASRTPLTSLKQAQGRTFDELSFHRGFQKRIAMRHFYILSSCSLGRFKT